MRMRYRIVLDDLPKKCDERGAKFTVTRALACKKGGLVVVGVTTGITQRIMRVPILPNVHRLHVDGRRGAYHPFGFGYWI